MTTENLEAVRNYLIDNVMRNDYVIYNDHARYCRAGTDYFVDLVDIIASLYNLLHLEITGEKYDYMFHWTNKVGGYVNENIFDAFLGGKHYVKVGSAEAGQTKSCEDGSQGNNNKCE